MEPWVRACRRAISWTVTPASNSAVTAWSSPSFHGLPKLAGSRSRRFSFSTSRCIRSTAEKSARNARGSA